ncbi:penicillin-binding protein 1C [Croceitalea sp. P059]|uniref:penicillin-binding protein 1C n=1 Tax=Croceitalea sp. P059 TaxID=3075601 RepID=UPI002887CB47|nr:penicillin-binding protein 1C [Croceitalea sp. P059]MDT0540676.1 penicillin-binding protein 1C [Croceitalea sp. P059]
MKKPFYKHKIKFSILLIFIILWLFCLPKSLFSDPISTVVESSNGTLIGARIAEDGQWRFPQLDSVPEKFKQSVLLFEDEHFYNHPGFNPVSILKAIKHNLTKDTRRGGSTITQQVIRLSRKNKRRNYLEKVIEVFLATRLEAGFSKDEILTLYASYTPYGGNVVGLETASWRYFGIPANELSWGQAASLAVLPNAPSLIFPGRNEQALLLKRNRLLKKLFQKDKIDEITYELAVAEPLPKKPLPLPNIAPHLTERAKKEHGGERVSSSLDYNLQQQVNRIANQNYQRLKNNEIHNLAILVMDVSSRKILAYLGNSPTSKEHDNYVDILTKKRSTGSTLKPFLFASLLHEGRLLPKALVEDIPTVINGYNPKNFNKNYSGAVPADRALSRSLNVPAVRLLQEYGLQKFYNNLNDLQFKGLDKSAGYYGLPIILGGAESSLIELTQSYASLASTLNYFNTNSSVYRSNEFQSASYLLNEQINFGKDQFQAPVLNAGSIYHTFKAMQEVNRPEGEENWQFFDESQPIAWKTGTSFGFKDAWAVGVTPEYAIGIWAGNADGEGRPGLTGITAAAPILFDVLQILPKSNWFEIPFDDLKPLEVCIKSGYRASIYCDHKTENQMPINGLKSKTCPFHEQLALDQNEVFQVTANCYPLENIKFKSWFSLPPVIEYYYATANPDYQKKPVYSNDCNTYIKTPMAFLYPKKNEIILVPKNLGNKTSEIILKLAHQQPNSEVFWYLDDTFINTTSSFHELIINIKPGNYLLSVVDDKGNRIQQQLKVDLASKN